MTEAVVTSGVIAVVALGFGTQNRAMLSAGAAHSLRPVVDGMVASIGGELVLFALAFGGLHLFAPWVSSTTMIIAALMLALSGLGRYVATPPRGYGPGQADEADMARVLAFKPNAALLPMDHFKSAESWALALFLAGAASSGSVSLAGAFAGLTLLSAAGLGVWALAGWSGCLHLASNWHRRHLDWGLGLLMFFAATAAIFSGG
ncbi:hypothetical protein [Hoeflea sp.]|uniref:hypothetical protein n=1 Tax=Hoeflea sp. TaxID=1940281 RepID=UPI003748C5ED